MANPEEAYQIARYLVDVLRGKIHPGPVSGLYPEDVSALAEGAVFELEGATGTFEIVVRERNR